MTLLLLLLALLAVLDLVVTLLLLLLLLLAVLDLGLIVQLGGERAAAARACCPTRTRHEMRAAQLWHCSYGGWRRSVPTA